MSVRARSGSLLMLGSFVIVAACGGPSGASDGAASGAPGAGGQGDDGGGVTTADGGWSGGSNAPQVTRVAYLRAPAGPHLLVAGSAPPDGVAVVHVDLFDASGNPVSVSDGASGHIESLDVSVGATGPGEFFLDNQSAAGFDALVAQVAVTPRSWAGIAGVTVRASIGDVPLRQDREPCDPRGFDACVTGDLCAPASDGREGVCTVEQPFRASLCAGAPQLDPDRPEARAVDGIVAPFTLWAPPADCVQASSLGEARPQGIARLHLARAIDELTLTTIDPATAFDTVLFLLPSCGDRAMAPLACNDDGAVGTTGSTLHLRALAAGDYVAVVTSAVPLASDAAARAYHLSVSAP